MCGFVFNVVGSIMKAPLNSLAPFIIFESEKREDKNKERLNTDFVCDHMQCLVCIF